ncbi:MAG TPA: TraM recognition domain-containing protein [Actinospica sp.]|jgi:type IV secretory pathway TraG/TraD family ATPase VirD4|nr:TraM recognition domain-containing protein [Actinospica sp.]
MSSNSARRAPSTPLITSGSDAALIGGIALVLIVTIGTYLTGQIAGLLFKLAWPPVDLGQTGAIIKSLPKYWGDPKQAWPTAAHGALPGPVGFAVAAMLSIVVTGFAVVTPIRIWRSFTAGSSDRTRGMATKKQLEKSLSRQAALRDAEVVRPSLAGKRRIAHTEVAVELGNDKISGLPLCATAQDSVLVAAPPRQGKSSQIVIPWVHRWPGPALVTSVRTDVLANTALLREECGPIAVLAPTGMTSWPKAVAWSPAAGCQRIDVARKRASVLVQVGKPGTDDDSSGAGFFGLTATNLLASWLHAVALTGRTMLDLLEWAMDEHDDTPLHLLRQAKKASHLAVKLLAAFYDNPPITKTNIFTTVQVAIAPLMGELAQASFAPKQEDSLDIEGFLRANGTIYLLVSEDEAGDLAPVVACFVDEVARTAYRLAMHSPGGRLDPPLGIFGDEIANVSPLPNLPTLMSYAGGSGIFVLAVFQSLAQAEHRWGRTGLNMMWGASTVKVALGGLTGEELKMFSELAGQYTETIQNHQNSPGGQSVTYSIQDRPSMTPDQVRGLDKEGREALIIHANTPAVVANMVRHYEGRDAALYAEAERTARERMSEADNYDDQHDEIEAVA